MFPVVSRRCSVQHKQTLHHHSSAVDFGANFQISPPFLKKPIGSPHIIHCEWMCGGFYYKFAKVNFALWRHVFNISVLTLRDCFGSASIMYVFSVRQTSQYFAPAVYTPVFARILHEISYSFLASFSFHTWVDSVVLFASLFLRLCLWLLNLSLNFNPVDPMYFIVAVFVRTSAWYTTGPSWHSL